MDDNQKIHISETQQPSDFSLDDILAEFRDAPAPAEDAPSESLSDRSRRLVLEQFPEGFDALDFSSLDDVLSDAVGAAEADDAGQPPEPALAGAGFEPSPETQPPAQAELAGFGFEADAPDGGAADEEPPDTPEDAAPEEPPDADAAEEGPADGAPEDTAPPEEEVLRFDDPEAVIEEALREYGSGAAAAGMDYGFTDRDADPGAAYASAGFERRGADGSPAAPGAEAAESDDDDVKTYEPDARPAPAARREDAADDADDEEDDEDEDEKPAPRRRGSAKERFLSPIVALLALLALRRAQRSERAAAEPEEPDAETAPEPEPEAALRAAGAQLGPLRLRGRIAVAMCLILIYLTYAASSALPLTGALKSNPSVLCLMLAILEMTVMMAGLNVFTDGLVALFRGRPNAQSLVAVSCVLTLLDAAVLAAMKEQAGGLPLCAASALGMTFAIWGEYWRCSALRRSYKVLTARNLYTVSGERGLTEEAALLRSRRSVRGFIRRSLEGDMSADVFRVLTPMLLIAALVLGCLASLVHGAPKALVHCVASIAAASCAFSATLCFTLPYAFASRRFSQNGAAVAGWPGVRDIGRSRNVVITDADVFPKGTVELGEVRIHERWEAEHVFTAVGSVLAASGSGLAQPFAQLLRDNACAIARVENFEAHDGGGMTAMVNGENVCVGASAFMNLMGVRVPQRLAGRSLVCAAINGSLAGVFQVKYRATGSVQEALVTLLHSNLEPIFALRDFNVTPQLLKDRFRLPTDSFRFPAYSERFRISGAEPDKSSRVAAAIVGEGMEPLVDAAERGRRLYGAVRIGTIITAVGCVFGLLMMFLMAWTHTYDVATASNVVTFMLLWLIPSVVVTWGVSR